MSSQVAAEKINIPPSVCLCRKRVQNNINSKKRVCVRANLHTQIYMLWQRQLANPSLRLTPWQLNCKWHSRACTRIKTKIAIATTPTTAKQTALSATDSAKCIMHVAC